MEYRKIIQWLIYLVALLTTAPLMAQVEDEEEDDSDTSVIVITESTDSSQRVKTIQIRIGTDKPITIRRTEVGKNEYRTVVIDTFKRKPRVLREVETEWLTLDIGLNTLLYQGSASLPTSLSNLELDPIKSVNVKVGIVKQRVSLWHHKLNLIYGLSYDNNDYRFQNNLNFRKNDSLGKITYDKMDPKTPGFVRNKLTTRFISLPVSFRYESNPNRTSRSFRVEVGMEAGLRLTSFFKTVREEDDDKIKKKEKDDFYLNNFRYGAFVKLGYGDFTIFANYIFTPLFRNNTGPELNTVSFGVCLWDDMF